MEKEEILKKSREENKKQDVYEKEIIVKENRYACLIAGIIATIFFVIQIFTGGGMNYGLYAVVFSMPMAGFWYKYIKINKKNDLFLAICYTVTVLLFSIIYIYNLISSSTIM